MKCFVKILSISTFLSALLLCSFLSPVSTRWPVFITPEICVGCPHLTLRRAERCYLILKRSWNFLFTWFELSLLILAGELASWLTQISFLSPPPRCSALPPRSQAEQAAGAGEGPNILLRHYFNNPELASLRSGPVLLTAAHCKLTLSLPSSVKLGLELQSLAGGLGQSAQKSLSLTHCSLCNILNTICNVFQIPQDFWWSWLKKQRKRQHFDGNLILKI